MNSYQQLINQIKTANYSGANQTFSEIMQQKAADRLTAERQQVFKEAAEWNGTCKACKAGFKTSDATGDSKCPKCGSKNVELE